MLLVTTTQHPTEAQIQRAKHVAERCHGIYLPRRGSVARLFRRNPDCALVYQVGRVRDEVRDRAGAVSVHAGLFAARMATDHPLIRALGPCRRVVDATLGLCVDALHIAGALRCGVVGTEASAIVHCLAEEGLRRLSMEPSTLGEAAGRIVPWHGRAEEYLATLPAGGADAVFVAPMFSAPKPASPGFALFRGMAVHDPLPEALVREALRVAPRLVVKVVKGEAAPDFLSVSERISGRALDYLVSIR